MINVEIDNEQIKNLKEAIGFVIQFLPGQHNLYFTPDSLEIKSYEAAGSIIIYKKFEKPFFKKYSMSKDSEEEILSVDFNDLYKILEKKTTSETKISIFTEETEDDVKLVLSFQEGKKKKTYKMDLFEPTDSINAASLMGIEETYGFTADSALLVDIIDSLDFGEKYGKVLAIKPSKKAIEYINMDPEGKDTNISKIKIDKEFFKSCNLEPNEPNYFDFEMFSKSKKINTEKLEFSVLVLDDKEIIRLVATDPNQIFMFTQASVSVEDENQSQSKPNKKDEEGEEEG
jgi:hypothetical protein